MFVSAGSMTRTATSPCARPASTEAMSLNSATRVVWLTGTAGPTFPPRGRVSPSSPMITNVSSTDPW